MLFAPPALKQSLPSLLALLDGIAALADAHVEQQRLLRSLQLERRELDLLTLRRASTYELETG